jgi:molybdopterin-guanine dinucleotide biosynthesis protein A
VSVTAIVLAGGRSRRFGGDKLAADVGGTAMLAATIAAVAPVADRVIVAGPRLPDDVPGEPPITLLGDAEPFAGPLVALAGVLAGVLGGSLAGGEPAPGGVAIVVGGDMPSLVPAVLVRMIDTLDSDPGLDAVLLGLEGADRRRVLPLALRVEPAARAARDATGAGERSLQAFVDRLAHVELDPASWRGLDPDARTLVDVDTRADLDRLG